MISYKTHGQKVFKNSQHFVVLKWTDDLITLKQTRGKHIGRIIDIDIKCSSSFKPGYAMTVHKSQCLTLPENYSIYEHEDMSNKMLYVAMTRATKKHTLISVIYQTINIIQDIFINTSIKENIISVQLKTFLKENKNIKQA